MESNIQENIKVSICCLTYNHSNYIRDCLEGFVMQSTDFDFEVLIHDDASIDNTAQIIKEYKNQYPEIIKPVYQEENKFSKEGGGMNIRYNFPRARGKYIALCEGDDYWTDPLKLQKQVDFLEENEEYYGCFHNVMMIDENEIEPVLKPWRTYTKEVFDVNDTISTTALLHTSSFLFRKKIFPFPLWVTQVQSGDMALFAIVAIKGPLFRINDFMSIYRKNQGGITNSITTKSIHNERIKLFKFLKESIKGSSKAKIKEVINFHRYGLLKLKRQDFENKLKIFLNRF